ncbi:hypothetical protein [uncultured Corynebacterium sp.]|uniref:hypothetical protein n=1 Tax=uncultured Corynebacterium sp. TaxID=159447 RepID=UPI002592F463|nr:hypothetical protein [uncultured Corynebacterium sp.]
MTTRWTKRAPAEPEEIAKAVPPAVASSASTMEYRLFFERLSWTVEDLTGWLDTSLTLAVAEHLGVSPSDWIQEKLCLLD